MTAYAVAATAIVLILALALGGRWVFRRGKEAGQKELLHAIEEKISGRDKKLFDRLMRPRPDDFGSVRHPDADWKDPTAKA